MVRGMETQEQQPDRLTELLAAAVGKAIADKIHLTDPDQILTAAEAAELLTGQTSEDEKPVTERMVKQMATQQGLPGRKISGAVGWRFTRNSLIDWIKHGND